LVATTAPRTTTRMPDGPGCHTRARSRPRAPVTRATSRVQVTHRDRRYRCRRICRCTAFAERASPMNFRGLITRSRDEEDGFTLIELMVVVLIIAILIAIAIPTFLGARQRAQDRASQSDLRNALTAEKTVYTDTQAYDATTATMQGVEASLNWNGADTTKTAM